MANSKLQNVKDFASMAGGVAKTFFAPDDYGRDEPEKRTDYGPGPEPEVKRLKPPDNYYKGYGAYAPRYSGNKRVSKKRSKKTRKASNK